MPRKERMASPGDAGTKLLNTLLPSASKYSSSVLARWFAFLPCPLPSGRSISVKTAPNP